MPYSLLGKQGHAQFVDQLLTGGQVCLYAPAVRLQVPFQLGIVLGIAYVPVTPPLPMAAHHAQVGQQPASIANLRYYRLAQGLQAFEGGKGKSAVGDARLCQGR